MKHTVQEMRAQIEVLQEIFDVARLVDPVNTKIIEFQENGTLEYKPYTCYRVWDKERRCENCISLRALKELQRKTKYEFVGDDIFHVTSKPITLIRIDGQESLVILELVSKITDEILFGAFGKNEIVKRIIESEQKIYKDSLTKVYNRRFFDEERFCHSKNGELSNLVTFIVVDFKKFKSINDNYGHEVGDWVLEHGAAVMQSIIRKSDFVIRIGGDEFLIVLNGCDEPPAQKIIGFIREKLKKQVVYDEVNNRYAIANFGVATTDSFVADSKVIAELLKKADDAMYLDKMKMG